MLALVFMVAGIVFAVMVWKALASDEIMARGWGFEVRMYNRYDHPIWFWVTLVSYSVVAVWATVFAIMAAFRGAS